MRFLKLLRYSPYTINRAPSRGLKLDALQREALFRSQTRWLWNNKDQRKFRRVDFDPDELQRIACETVGAKECIEFRSLPEGSYNRTYRLSFDNGEQATLKIPFPLPGHTSRRTSSEVATLQYIKDTCSIPVPSILAWSAQKDATPVGSEFILLKYVPGDMLAYRWDEPYFDTMAIYHPLYVYEEKFQAIPFSGVGSLYFTEDVSAELQERPLFADGVPPKYEAVKDKYRLGPLADRQYWRGPRNGSMYDHGPWPDMLSFFMSAAQNQLLFLNLHAKDDAPFRRPPFHSREVHASILKTYLETIPLILPPEETLTPMLWHPDINGQNIIVESEGRPTVRGLIDWQDTTIMPFFMQATPPPLLIVEGDEFGFKPKDGVREPDPFPDNPAEHGISAEDEPRARVQYERISRMMFYIGKQLEHNHRRAQVLSLPHTDIIGMLPFHIIRSWEDGIIPVRKALYKIHDSWDDLARPGAARPSALVKMCLNRAADEAEHRTWDLWMLKTEEALDWIACRGDGLLSDNNSVANQTREAAPQLKAQWDTDDGLPDPFPFVDGSHSFFLS